MISVSGSNVANPCKNPRGTSSCLPFSKAQLYSRPLPISGRAFANVHGHIQQRPRPQRTSFALRMGRCLKMQPAHGARLRRSNDCPAQTHNRSPHQPSRLADQLSQKNPRASPNRLGQVRTSKTFAITFIFICTHTPHSFSVRAIARLSCQCDASAMYFNAATPR